MTTAWFSRFWDRLRSAFAGAESASYAYDNHRLMARKLALA